MKIGNKGCQLPPIRVFDLLITPGFAIIIFLKLPDISCISNQQLSETSTASPITMSASEGEDNSNNFNLVSVSRYQWMKNHAENYACSRKRKNAISEPEESFSDENQENCSHQAAATTPINLERPFTQHQQSRDPVSAFPKIR